MRKFYSPNRVRPNHGVSKRVSRFHEDDPTRIEEVTVRTRSGRKYKRARFKCIGVSQEGIYVHDYDEWDISHKETKLGIKHTTY